MIGIVISTIIVIIVSIIYNHYFKNSKDKNFKDNNLIYILSVVSLLINFYLIIPRELYYYKKYMNKIE